MKKDITLDIALLVIRIAVGVTMAFYGAQKAFGWFGGDGFHGTIEWLRGDYGIADWATVCAIMAQLAGGLGILFGFITRPAAASVTVSMAVVIFVTYSEDAMAPHHPFIMMAFRGGLMAMALAIWLTGPGALSLDRVFFGKGRRKRAS